jgi:hypothetical protein
VFHWLLKQNTQALLMSYYGSMCAAFLFFIFLKPLYFTVEFFLAGCLMVGQNLLGWSLYAVLPFRKLFNHQKVKHLAMAILGINTLLSLVLFYTWGIRIHDPGVWVLLIFAIWLFTSFLRCVFFATVISSVEEGRKVLWTKSMEISFLLCNPLIGFWHLHPRIQKICS